jgi:hypothetical protein
MLFHNFSNTDWGSSSHISGKTSARRALTLYSVWIARCVAQVKVIFCEGGDSVLPRHVRWVVIRGVRWIVQGVEIHTLELIYYYLCLVDWRIVLLKPRVANGLVDPVNNGEQVIP